MIEVRYANGNDDRRRAVGTFSTEKDARKAAAAALGAKNLRGASSWPTETGVVFQFGSIADTDNNPTAELIYL